MQQIHIDTYRLAFEWSRPYQDANKVLNLLPPDSEIYANGMRVLAWFMQEEPRGCKRMGTDRGGENTRTHNREQLAEMLPGRHYVLYDHYRTAFWGPDCGGYATWRGAGLYTKETAPKAMADSNRYFTAVLVPEPVEAALREHARIMKPEA